MTFLYITDTLTRTATTVQNWFLNLTLDEGTDPPQLTGPNGPPVRAGIGTQGSSLFASERELAIPVGDLADLVSVFKDGTGERVLPTARYAPDGGTEVLVRTDNGSGAEIFTRDSFGYCQFRADRTVDEAVDGGVMVQARIGSAGAVLASAAGATVEAVRMLLLADAALDSIRSLIVAAELVQVASTVTTTEATTSLLTGRDTYQVNAITFGPTDGVMVGNLGECATPLTGCEGGTEVTIGTGATHFNTVTLQDLYITDTLAIETGPWSWRGGGARATGDRHKLGLFGTYENGPLTFGWSGFVGQQKVEAEDALGATADDKVQTRGLATRLGYAIRQGDWTLTPSVGVSWLHWAAPQVTDGAGNRIDAARISQIRPELGLSVQRSFATARGVLNRNLDARVWTMTGDRTAVTSLGVLTQGPELGRHGGSIGIGANWRISPRSALSARVEHSFSDRGNETEGRVALKIRF